MGIIDTLKNALGFNKETMPAVKPGRNDPCWCGSGKKYKHCHLAIDEKKRSAILAKNVCKGPT